MAVNPFDALGLPARPDLSDEQVRAAWRAIAAATHPDRRDGGDVARYTAATAAYAVLRTPGAAARPSPTWPSRWAIPLRCRPWMVRPSRAARRHRRAGACGTCLPPWCSCRLAGLKVPITAFFSAATTTIAPSPRTKPWSSMRSEWQ